MILYYTRQKRVDVTSDIRETGYDTTTITTNVRARDTMTVVRCIMRAATLYEYGSIGRVSVTLFSFRRNFENSLRDACYRTIKQ